METNKVFALQKLSNFYERTYEWWAVIDCGVTQTGGYTTGDYWMTHFKHNGRTYRWYAKLFMPPADLVEWQEISVLQKQLTVVDKEGHAFEGWNDEVDLGYKTLSNFASLIGKPMTIEEVKEAIEKTHK